MLKKIVLILCIVVMAGCSAKHNSLNMMPVPHPGTREALLPTFEPTGSACLDSIVVNMLYTGCSEVGFANDESGARFMGCISPQPGAQDVYSIATFVYTTQPQQLPQGAQPLCGDTTGVYAVWGVPFLQLVSND